MGEQTTPKQRRQFYERHLRGETYHQIAEQMGVSWECVRHWCRRQRAGGSCAIRRRRVTPTPLKHFAPRCATPFCGYAWCIRAGGRSRYTPIWASGCYSATWHGRARPASGAISISGPVSDARTGSAPRLRNPAARRRFTSVGKSTSRRACPCRMDHSSTCIRCAIPSAKPVWGPSYSRRVPSVAHRRT
jgi:hypothetical protein